MSKKNKSAGTASQAVREAGSATNLSFQREISSAHPLPLTMQNVVSTFNSGVPIVLSQIALKARNAEYNPKRFSAVIMRIREPRTTALIFASGKVVVTGAKSEGASKLAARKFLKVVRKLCNQDAQFLEFKIQNMVASCAVNFPTCLEGVAQAHYKVVKYEPEVFPGLVYHLTEPGATILIFVTGKMVITGAKCREHISQAFNKVYPIVQNFRKVFD